MMALVSVLVTISNSPLLLTASATAIVAAATCVHIGPDTATFAARPLNGTASQSTVFQRARCSREVATATASTGTTTAGCAAAAAFAAFAAFAAAAAAACEREQGVLRASGRHPGVPRLQYL